MNKFDFNCYCGNWPFYRVRYNTLKKLAELHGRCGIEGGFVSSCEAIFYQDPYEAEVALSKEISGTSYQHVMVLNPTLPGWKDDLARCVNILGIKAVRLMPGFHGYELTDPLLDEVCDMLRQCRLPLLLTLRIRDERSSWMVHPRKLPVDEIAAFLEKNPDITTVLACLRMNELMKLKEVFGARKNLFLDISGLKDGNFIVEKVCDTVGSDHVLYGSSAPILNLQSTTMLVEQAELSEDTKDDIFSGRYLLQQI